MKNLYLLFVITLLFVSPVLKSQTFPYTLFVSSAPYENLEGATDLTTGVWDDPIFEVPLGFDFDFYGETFNTVYQTGLGATMGFSPNAYYTGDELIFAYGSDLIDRGDIDNVSVSKISYKTEGTPGSRICKIEWNNAGFYNELSFLYTNTNFINLQLWLYEGSNDFEIRFGPNEITLDDTVHDFNGMPMIGVMEGLDANAYSYDAFWYLTGPSTGPEIGLSTMFNDIYTLSYLSDNPADGTVYRFSTGVTSSREQVDLGRYIKTYPTVTRSHIWLEVADEMKEDGTITIVNSLGQIIKTQSLQRGTQQIDLNHLPAGQYFINVQTEAGFYSGKFIKQ